MGTLMCCLLPTYNYNLYGSVAGGYQPKSCFCQPTICLPTIPTEQPSQPPTIDAVSLALALQSQKESIREDRLQFGPNKLPLDGRLIKSPNNIPEEGLHTLYNQIVELKPVIPQKTLAQEAAESYLNDCCDTQTATAPFLTYADVGYVAEEQKCPQFDSGVPNPYPQTGTVIYNGPAPCICATPPNCPTLPSCPCPTNQIYPTLPNCLPTCPPQLPPCQGIPNCQPQLPQCPTNPNCPTLPNCLPNCPPQLPSCQGILNCQQQLPTCSCIPTCQPQLPTCPCIPNYNPHPTCPPVPTCSTPCGIPPSTPCAYQPGGVFITQQGCRNGACAPELLC